MIYSYNINVLKNLLICYLDRIIPVILKNRHIPYLSICVVKIVAINYGTYDNNNNKDKDN